MQERLALELMKMQIEEAKAGSSQQTSHRGSWRFEPGLDVLDSVDDDALLDELRNENFDPAKALEKLKVKAAKSEGITVPESNLNGGAAGLAREEDSDEGDDKKKCVIM